MEISKRILLRGRVQGVGFRHFTRKTAEQLGVTGWVKNLPDGGVLAVVQGTPSQVNAMIARLKEGPRYANVISVDITPVETQEFSGFEVRYGS
jgi:acylphosphatase